MYVLFPSSDIKTQLMKLNTATWSSVVEERLFSLSCCADSEEEQEIQEATPQEV